MSQNLSNETKNETLENKLRKEWTNILAKIWNDADWRKIARNRRASDVFEHRLRVASTRSTIQQAVRKLCNGLSLQAPEMDIDSFDTLIKHHEKALKILREEDVYLTLKAKQTVDNFYDKDLSKDELKKVTLKDFVQI